jgi:hypothetical protein
VRALRRTIAVFVVSVGVVLGVIVGLAYLIGRDIGLFGALGIAMALVFAVQIQFHLHEPSPLRERPPAERPVGKPFGRFQVLRERLRWGVTSAEHFNAAVRPVIVELTDDRLLRHHGVVRQRHPAAADALLAPALAEFLEATGDPEAPSIAALSVVLTELEEL